MPSKCEGMAMGSSGGGSWVVAGDAAILGFDMVELCIRLVGGIKNRYIKNRWISDIPFGEMFYSWSGSIQRAS